MAITKQPLVARMLVGNSVPIGMLLLPQQMNAKLRDDWVAFEAEQRVPVMTGYRGLGCLLSYGPDGAAMFRRLGERLAYENYSTAHREEVQALAEMVRPDHLHGGGGRSECMPPSLKGEWPWISGSRESGLS